MKYGYPKTYAFFKEHSRKIRMALYFVIFYWVFVPTEKKHYMSGDIDQFSDAHYLSICIVLSALFVLTIFSIVWWKSSIQRAVISLLPSSLAALYGSFFLQSFIIALCLWINRFTESDRTVITYQITQSPLDRHRMIVEKETRNLLDEDDESRMDLFSQVIDLKLEDTFDYTFYKGLFGIRYIPENH